MVLKKYFRNEMIPSHFRGDGENYDGQGLDVASNKSIEL